MDSLGPAQLFFEAKENGADINLHFISSTTDNELRSSLGLGFSKLTPYEDFELAKCDIIVISGVDFSLLKDFNFKNKNQSFYHWLNEQYYNGATLVSICTGAFILADAGLLKGKKATTHWKAFDELNKNFQTQNYSRIDYLWKTNVFIRVPECFLVLIYACIL